MTRKTYKNRGSRVSKRSERARLRARPLEPVRTRVLEVSDIRIAAFHSEARCQSLAVARSARAVEDQNFIDAVSDHGET